MDTLVRNGRIVRCDGDPALSARERLRILDRGAVGIDNGSIVWVGTDDEAKGLSATTTLDAEGGAVLPGLVDPHTHLVFGGSRAGEFARRMGGEDYRTIAAEGGGITSTVRATREASDDTLRDGAERRALAMRELGVTSIEIKSGYGLSLEDELRCLRIGRHLGKDGPVRTSMTFLGAHTVPPEMRNQRGEYLDLVVEQMLPRVVDEGLADACDVYLDEGAFTRAEAHRVLRAAKAAGLQIRAHIGQFKDLGGASLLAELGALSADHVEQISEEGARALASAGVVVVLLPGAWRTLRQTPPDVAMLRRAGVSFAVGTDCNPGTSPCTDLSLCAALAVRDAGLTVEEAVLAVTVHAARAAGLPKAGRIAVGAFGDLAIYGHDDPCALAYAMGDLRPRHVLLRGRRVAGTERPPLW
ncbi:MAG: imidazolonepropionase [Myxococcales bacterium]|nr:imidazolonepropionase [Myxococcales bacterium]